MESEFTNRQNQYLDELKQLCNQRRLPIRVLKYGERIYFVIKSEISLLLGFFTTPDAMRIWDDRAWNRISNSPNSSLRTLHGTKEQGKTIKGLVIQVWLSENAAVILPLDTLNKVSTFRETGDFNVMNDSRGFYLRAPKNENNIYLEIGIENIFKYLE